MPNEELSSDELDDIEMLGGIDRVADTVDRILAEHGIDRVLFTKREREQIRRRSRSKTEGRFIEFNFDPIKSIRANIDDLIDQASDLEEARSGTNYVGIVLQHLVGAKLDIVLGKGKVKHHGSSVADQSSDREADYQIDALAIHVATSPTEALMRKCGESIKAGIKPLILTVGEAVKPAEYMLASLQLGDRVDVLDIAQFLTANVYERSLFVYADCKLTLASLLGRYNEIVAECENDPTLRIRFGR